MSQLLLHDPVEALSLHTTSSHGTSYIPLEAIAIAHEVVGRILVEGITGVGLEEEELQTNDHGVEVEDRLPVFSQNVQTDVAFEIDVGMVDLLFALDFWWFVGEVLRDDEGEVEDAALVESFIGCESEGEVEDIVGVGKV